MAFGLYIHIPYCKSRCGYCNFYTCGGHNSVPQNYVDALCAEIKRHGASAPATLYFGGGTPSLLSGEQVEQLVAAANPAVGAEVTLEVNPATADEAKLSAFKNVGVNRLSIGVQSADDAILRTLGRTHSAAEARHTFALAKAAGFTNISGDIIVGAPGDSEKTLEQTIELIVQGGATHVSAYMLKIEEGTPFFEQPPAGVPSNDGLAALYTFAAAQLKMRGFDQYEISNFAKSGFEGQHNLMYWDCENYLGIGPAAHSCMDGRRFYYKNDTAAFIESAQSAIVQDGELTAQDYIMLQLRLAGGLNFAALHSRFHYTFSASDMAFFEQLAAGGLCTLSGDSVALTPKGMLVENAILARLI